MGNTNPKSGKRKISAVSGAAEILKRTASYTVPTDVLDKIIIVSSISSLVSSVSIF